MKKFIEDMLKSLAGKSGHGATLEGGVTDDSTARQVETDGEDQSGGPVAVAFCSGRHPAQRGASPFWQCGEDWSTQTLSCDASLSSGKPRQPHGATGPRLIWSDGAAIDHP